MAWVPGAVTALALSPAVATTGLFIVSAAPQA
jgi:hypothetical protein